MDLILEGKINQYGTIPKVFLGVPFQTEKGTPGVIGVQSYKDENAFQNRDLKLLNFISNQVLLSVERKFIEEKLIHKQHDCNPFSTAVITLFGQ